MKSTVDEIRQRFDADVERFSNLDVGQSAAVDSPLTMGNLADRNRRDWFCAGARVTYKVMTYT